MGKYQGSCVSWTGTIGTIAAVGPAQQRQAGRILQPPALCPSLGFILWLWDLDTSDEVGAELEEAELAL